MDTTILDIGIYWGYIKKTEKPHKRLFRVPGSGANHSDSS